MCGRFTINQSNEAVIKRFEVQESLFTITPRYNVAPSQTVGVVLNNGVRCLDGFRWGLIPSWSKNPKIGNKLINARAETLSEKPSFRSAYKRRRCLVPTTGFYEWQTQDNQRIPTFIYLKDCDLFSLAGLWEEWRAPDDSIIRSFAIITVAPNHFMEKIHQRMPAILKPEAEAVWLDASLQDEVALQKLLQPYPSEAMNAYRVSKYVNSPIHDDPQCIEHHEDFS